MAINIFERLPNGTKVKVRRDATCFSGNWGKVVTIKKSVKHPSGRLFDSYGWRYDINENGFTIWGNDIECVVDETLVWVNKDTPEEFPEADMAQEIERLEGMNKFLLAKCREQQEEFKKLEESYNSLKKDYFVELMDNMAFTDVINDKIEALNIHNQSLELQVENQIKLRDYWLKTLENLNWFQKLIISYDTIKRDYCRLRLTLPKNPIVRRESGATKPDAGSATTTTPEEKAKYEEGNGTGY